MKRTIACCLKLLLASTALCRAQTFEVSPFYGYRFGGEIQDSNTGAKHSFEDSQAYGLFIDYGPTNSNMKLELAWSRQDSSVDLNGESGLGRVDLTIDQIQIGGSAEMGTKRLREYVSGMLGATYFSSDGYGSDTKFSLGVGVGVKYFLLRNLALRADLRGFCTIVDSEGAFIYYNGVTVASFSGSTVWQGQATIGASLAF